MISIHTVIGFIISALTGAFYGGVVAAGVAVFRFSNYAREQYPELRTWSILLILFTTIIMWIWPFSYILVVWYLFRWLFAQGNVLSFIVLLISVLVKPVVAILTAVFGVRLYERSRSTGVDGRVPVPGV